MASPIHVVSVIAVIYCQKKYLLVQRSKHDDLYPNKWQNLGGKVENGELIEQSLQREIAEEVGLEIKQKPIYLQSYNWQMIPDQPYRLGLIYLFQLSGEKDNYQITLSDELQNYGWYKSDEIKKLDTIGKGHASTLAQILQAEEYLL